MWILPLVLALVLLGLMVRRKMQLVDAKLASIPLAPRRSKIPIAGYVVDLMTAAATPWAVIDHWIRSTGPVLRFNFFSNQFVVIADPDLIKHVFQNKFQNYQKDILISYSPFMPLLGSGLVTSHGEHWLNQRKLLGAVFKIEILQDTVKVAINAANRLGDKIDGWIAQGNGTSAEVEIGEEFRRLTLQVIGDAVLSLTPEESDRVFPSLYLPIVDLANENVWYPWKAYIPSAQLSMARHALKDLNKFFMTTINDRIKSYDPDADVDSKQNKDILGKIISGMDGNGTLYQPGVVTQMCDEIKTFIFAGHETSSMMLTWALYELFKNPECMQKVLEEANKVFPLNGETPSFEKVQELNYTQNCLKEALRKYYVVPVVTRIATEDDTLGTHHIPKGTRIVIPILSIHHREDLWDQPDKFIPERFDNPNMHPYVFLGFIAGARRCLGQHFALMETKIVLALLVQRFHFGGHPSGKPHPYKIPICPADGMLMEVSKRQ